MEKSNDHTSMPEVISVGGGAALLAIGKIVPLEELVAAANEDELKSIESFTAPSRRAERLAWRQMLRKVANQNVEITYNNQGAPQLRYAIVKDGVSYRYISVSHCRDMVAVMLSSQPCGVDVEQMARNFERVSSRYITDEERRLSDNPRFEATVWCAKEALYKLAQREGLDFRSDIHICAIDFAAATIVGRVEDSLVDMQMLWLDEEHIVVCALARE
jgi:phosphopantetheinyl transferase